MALQILSPLLDINLAAYHGDIASREVVLALAPESSGLLLTAKAVLCLRLLVIRLMILWH